MCSSSFDRQLPCLPGGHCDDLTAEVDKRVHDVDTWCIQYGNVMKYFPVLLDLLLLQPRLDHIVDYKCALLAHWVISLATNVVTEQISRAVISRAQWSVLAQLISACDTMAMLVSQAGLSGLIVGAHHFISLST